MGYRLGTVCIIFFTLFAFLLPGPAQSATITLDPVTSAVPVGQTFTVYVGIDTEGEEVVSADVILKFDSAYFQIVSVTKGTNGLTPFFADFFHSIYPNEVYLGAAHTDPVIGKIGSGVLGTITLMGKTAGVTDLLFDCTAGKTSDTNIIKADQTATDIVNCTRLVNGRYTIGSGLEQTYSEPTAQPVLTQAVGSSLPVTTPTPYPTLIQSGITDITIGVLTLGILLLGLSCAGFIFIKS